MPCAWVIGPGCWPDRQQQRSVSVMTVRRGESGVNSVFTPDTEFELAALAALINTAEGLGPSGREDLATVQDAREFAAQWQWTGVLPRTPEDVDALRAARSLLHGLWPLVAEGDEVLAARLNALLRDYRALPQLARHDDFGWHIHAVPADAPFATRVAVEAVMALVDLVRVGQTGRLRVCVAPGCESVLIDLSKNRSRKYCDGACANRAHAAAYRARRTVDAR